jgi:hypothetical protein
MKNMTLNEAAKASGRSKGTISKALNTGRLSYISKTDSGYQIDPSELFRVFPVGQVNTKEANIESRLETHDEHHKNTLRIMELELRLEAEKREKAIYLERLNEHVESIADYRARLTQAQETIHNQTLLLNDLREQKTAIEQVSEQAIEQKKKSWYKFWS